MTKNQPSGNAFDDAIFAFQQMRVPAPPVDAILLERMSSTSSEFYQPSIPRLIYIVGPLVAAASVLLAFIAWLVVSAPASIVMADVILAAASHDLVRMTQVQITEDKANGRGETKSIVYWDLTTPRCRSESQIGNTFLLDVQDYATGRHLMSDSKKKVASLFVVNPRHTSFLDNLQRLKDRGETRRTVDLLNGQPTIRFTLKEGGNLTSIWVNQASNLPVRMEFEMVAPTANISLNKWTWTGFQWDPIPRTSLDFNELFDTMPPAGYEVVSVDNPSRDGR